MLNYQQFKYSKSDATELKASKCPCINEHDNEEGQGLDKYQAKDGRYIFFHLCPPKKSNRLTNLGKKSRSLNYLIYIQKLLYQIIAYWILEFLNREGLKAQKNFI